jgi:hypothetical protein
MQVAAFFLTNSSMSWNAAGSGLGGWIVHGDFHGSQTCGTQPSGWYGFMGFKCGLSDLNGDRWW